MDIKLEIEALVDVGNNMIICTESLNDVNTSLNAIHIDFWQGNGRKGFDQILIDMREHSLSAAQRLEQSAITLGNALQKYNEIELGNFKANTNLPSDDIF